MSNTERDTQDSIEPRTERALTESMTVLPEGGDIYTLVGENGNGEYRVDGREGRCTCADHKHRGVECKHLRRVAFATGERPVPAGVDGVDLLLGEHTDGQAYSTTEEPVVATDGGEVLEEGDGRPEDCDCAPCLGDLPCWPCYRAGFNEPPGDE